VEISLFQVEVPFGRSFICLDLSEKPVVLKPRQSATPLEENLELQRALLNPIGSRKLSQIASAGDSVAIVVNDLTRPIPSDKIVPLLLKELSCVGVQKEHVSIVVATGVHRSCRKEELSRMLGKAAEQNVTIENHDCRNVDGLVNVGKTRGGVPVIVNRTFGEADIKILTGMVSPHHVAGYSGGRKSVMPGVAGLDALRIHHSQRFRPIGPAMGLLEGNRFHREAEEAAEIAGVDFIVNVVLNSNRQLVKATAGDMKESWQAAVSASEALCQIDVAEHADIVVTSPGGYPKDVNLWQSQKAISSAEVVVREGGTIILVAECEEGFGEYTFAKFFERTTSARDVIDEFNRRGYEPGLSKAFMYARALERAEIIVVTDKMSDAELAKIYTRRANSIDDALEMGKSRIGGTAKIAVMPHATEIVPVVTEQ